MRTTRPGRAAAVLAATVLGLTAAACTAGRSEPGAGGPALGDQQTIQVWHGWSADHEVKGFEQAVDGFRRKHPNITVKVTGNQTDDQITNAIRGGGPPDVVASFTTDNLGQFCSSGAWQDLTPLLGRDGIDLNVFPKAVREYTQYKGKRCAMPLLADAYGLYYNKRLMKGHQPPRTMTELADLAKRLTVRNPDGTIKVAGFMPSVQYYEHTPQHVATQFGVRWLGDDGKAVFAKDPAWKAYLKWSKDLLDWYGYDNAKRFMRSMGQEFEASNPFQKEKVAMAIDGEWRTKFIEKEAPGLDYGTAPAPVSDDRAAQYGSGFVLGTIMGVPRGARHSAAAWAFVKYLTTDTQALVTLANALGNVPSTLPALSSPDLRLPAQFGTFLNVFRHPGTTTSPSTPNGGDYLVKLQQFVQEQWEPGKVKDLDEALRDLDAKVDESLRLAGG
ncbi:extracellular solute-binding protein [Actinomadura kijaniata]|uniref:Multiple sugar transport system substrate-binding protein n=1 Tax=Actinomadura namibiensis TaxID=182080 RepID=A0A7W3LZQ0_ACTNM|nr:ABC transporter substrate-binding protein [Actinomadura namibiensis]MBA8957291.1 multiple sugar transport system substrate-binding protein [Actinomadura namibiensis]